MSKEWDCSDLDALILEQMADWQVPGIAVGIVKDGKIIYQKGLGTRAAGKKAPISENTLFPIGSATKAFTALAAAILADEGRLDWDTPVKQYLPDFKMFDSFARERLTVRDMLCHRSGLPRHEFMWYRAKLTRKEIVEHIGALEPNKEMRTTWQYNNEMYAAVGYLIEVISGLSWEAFVRKRIFEPLGMNRSNFSVETLKLAEDVSFPYAQAGDGVQQIDYCNLDVIGPAGSINSCLSDMLRWLMLHLNHGSIDGKQLVSRENIRQLHEPHIFCQPFAWRFDEIQASSYGLGWFTDIFRGKKMVSHGGNIDGFSALVGFLPDENVGLVILSNLNNNFLNYPLMYTVFDRALGVEGTNWFAKEKKEFTHFMELMTEAMKQQSAGDSGEKELLSADELRKYAGTYHSAGYGTVQVSVDGDHLQMNYNQTDFAMTHKKEDEFGFVYPLLSVGFPARFHVEKNGRADAVSIPFEPTVSDIVFTRV